MVNSNELVFKILGDDADNFDDDDDEVFHSDQDISIVSAPTGDTSIATTSLSTSDGQVGIDKSATGSKGRVKSLLGCLHRPTSSELVHKQKIDKNP